MSSLKTGSLSGTLMTWRNLRGAGPFAGPRQIPISVVLRNGTTTRDPRAGIGDDGSTA
jgi:hypothetical protein